jgi:general secretion pathway protein I
MFRSEAMMSAGDCPFRDCTLFGSTGQSPTNGFTLIEMMVALAVFGLAALALIRLEGATLKSTAALESHSMAQIVANNLAVIALSDPRAPGFGTATGVAENGGHSWRWVRVTKRTADAGIVRIDIAVSDGDGHPSAQLTLARAVG